MSMPASPAFDREREVGPDEEQQGGQHQSKRGDPGLSGGPAEDEQRQWNHGCVCLGVAHLGQSVQLSDHARGRQAGAAGECAAQPNEAAILEVRTLEIRQQVGHRFEITRAVGQDISDDTANGPRLPRQEHRVDLIAELAKRDRVHHHDCRERPSH